MRGSPFIVAACVVGLVFATGALAADQSGTDQSGSSAGQSGSSTDQNRSSDQSGTSENLSSDTTGQSGTMVKERDRMALREFRLDLGANVIGSQVRNQQNEKLGKLSELAIDPDLARVAYGVLESGGLLGVGDKYFAIPFASLSFEHKDTGDTGKIDHVALNIDKNRLKDAPGFDKNKWPDMANQEWATNVHKFYNQQPYWERQRSLRGEPVSPEGRDQGATPGKSEGTTGEKSESTGGTSDTGAGHSDMSTGGGMIGTEAGKMSEGNRRILKADADIRGRTVRDSAGAEIGKVSDLLINERTGNVPFVLLKLNDASKFGDKNNDFAAIPFNGFNWTDVKTGERKDLTLNISTDKIKGQTFSNDKWPDLTSREWAVNLYRHYGLPPTWARPGGMMGGSERGNRE
jgi:sporulation protein YlmC with PRC-barrel domain